MSHNKKHVVRIMYLVIKLIFSIIRPICLLFSNRTSHCSHMSYKSGRSTVSLGKLNCSAIQCILLDYTTAENWLLYVQVLSFKKKQFTVTNWQCNLVEVVGCRCNVFTTIFEVYFC